MVSITNTITGGTLRKKYTVAVIERNKHVEAHRDFTATLAQEEVAKWEKIAVTWDSDLPYPKKAFNPFEIVGDGKYIICAIQSD